MSDIRQHTGTHVDAPRFLAGATSGYRLPVDRLIAPLAVIEIADRAAKTDTLVTVDDVLLWEKRYGRVPAGALVAMHAGWDARQRTPDRFLNRDVKGTLHAPGFSEQAARFLVAERDICGVGRRHVESGRGRGAKVRRASRDTRRRQIRRRADGQSRTRPPSGATVVVGAPKHDGATGGPARVLALV